MRVLTPIQAPCTDREEGGGESDGNRWRWTLNTWRAGLNTPYTWIYYAWNVYYTPARNTSSCNAHNRWLYACTDMHTNTYIYKYIQTYVQTCTRVCVSLCLFVIEAKVAATADTAFFLLSCHFTWQTDKKCDAHSNAQKVFQTVVVVVVFVVEIGSYLACHSTRFDYLSLCCCLPSCLSSAFSLQLIYTQCLQC